MEALCMFILYSTLLAKLYFIRSTYGSVCIAPNPKSNQICPTAGTKIPGPVDCFALSRVTYFVQPVFDPVWQRLQDNKALADNYPKSNNPFLTDYQYQAFKHYIQGVRICKKKAPYFKYWTYARVHAGPVPVYPAPASGM
ncbi:hypothetical protein BCR33DRAFT_719351 [Rhizoclosmatium globosum]|uniref:Uncharacterized protein n=1 Tax=Rhizoclosmatium globosum TaxID=329046 RepID=A0A1Y2C0D0_9FUNG|nr:hypothetical protein BCR33DRAFT_719351 [Rhizoclosmatium globosum]|eukprot:ORY40337.1 hypothetical protein BCR33DRAFT_719351 [Rhizoclosmatium globosum]